MENVETIQIYALQTHIATTYYTTKAINAVPYLEMSDVIG